MLKSETPQDPNTPFRLHFSDGTTTDIMAQNPAQARKLGSREGLAIRKIKVIKEQA
jgi:hypothetical protein